MATASVAPGSTPTPVDPAAPSESIWRAPLVSAALAVTAGIVLDRYVAVPVAVTVTAAVLSLLAWLIARLARPHGLDLVYLALAGAAFGAAYHHYRRDAPADDVCHLAPVDPQPAQLRGVLDEEPFGMPAQAEDPLRSMPRGESTRTVVLVTHLRQRDDWIAVSGRVQLWVAGTLPDLHVGDEVEVVGLLAKLNEPANPGEFDYAGQLRDQGIHTRMQVRKTADGVTRLAPGWHSSFQGWLAVARGWGQRVFARTLPPRTSSLAMALLLGEGAPMTREDWQKYVCTGVIHVLAISGQHLVILASFLWWTLPRLGVRVRSRAWIVALTLLLYALLTGGRPPALRSAVMVCAACGGLILNRTVLPANLFALAWLTVALLNPMDLFTPGCQLSFLSVAVLYWGVRHAFPKEDAPLKQMIDESRPAWERCLRGVGRWLVEAYAVSLFVWLAVAPLVASYHLVSPIGILLGPPLTLLTTVALFAGFLLLLAGAVCWPLTALFAPIVDGSLAGCEWLVDWGKACPGSHLYVGDVPEWWLWIFYAALLLLLTQQPLRRRWHWGLTAGLGWLCLGLLCGAARLPSDELRCTFLAVGHGGCTVLETPDGRTLVYDAGALGGPDVARRQIAPYLWSRGIRRIDEVFLSHGDLDHFNGLAQLADRFRIGQVTCTPTFPDKNTPGIRSILDMIERRGIPRRMVQAGDRLTSGDVTLDVLHPPAKGPEGNENARSLVLEIRHAGHTLLLTGDLEGPGLERVLALPGRRIDVFQAPHHGSRLANTTELAAWAQPRVVVSCQGPPRGRARIEEPYTARGARFLPTWTNGAITVHSHASGLVVETFGTKERFVIRSTPPAGK